MTAEQIEQKKQRLHLLALEAQAICKELVEAGAWPLDDNDLDEAAGGKKVPLGVTPPKPHNPFVVTYHDLESLNK